MRPKFAVLISGNGSTLQGLIDSGDLIHIRVVISSNENAYGIIRARRAGIPVLTLPHDLRGKDRKSKAEAWILSVLEKYQVQKVFLCGYMKIISPEFIKKFPNSIFNVHPSLLPKYKGLNSFDDALKNEDKSAGVTIHHVAEAVDSGAFILQREFEIPSSRDANNSHLWLHIQEQRALRESLRKIG